MNDLKQEYLDKKYSYLDDNSFNVKPKASKKKKPKKANHKHQYHCAIIIDSQQDKHYISYCSVCGKVNEFHLGEEYRDLPKEFSGVMAGSFGIFGLSAHTDYKRFEDFCTMNFPTLYVENYEAWKTKYILIREDNE